MGLDFIFVNSVCIRVSVPVVGFVKNERLPFDRAFISATYDLFSSSIVLNSASRAAISLGAIDAIFAWLATKKVVFPVWRSTEDKLSRDVNERCYSRSGTHHRFS